jgi:hypothetical protein
MELNSTSSYGSRLFASHIQSTIQKKNRCPYRMFSVQEANKKYIDSISVMFIYYFTHVHSLPIIEVE